MTRQSFNPEPGDTVVVRANIPHFGGHIGTVDQIVREGTSDQRPTILGVRFTDGRVADFTPSELRRVGGRFRTPTGQTGPDAYLYEAAQIINTLRDLDERTRRLAAAMAAELPADLELRWPIPSAQYPDATTPVDRAGMARVLEHATRATDARQLAEYARAMTRPDHVIRPTD